MDPATPSCNHPAGLYRVLTSLQVIPEMDGVEGVYYGKSMTSQQSRNMYDKNVANI